MDLTKEFRQFCEAMAESMNIEAMKYANPLITWESVAKIPEAITTFELTYKISQICANI